MPIHRIVKIAVLVAFFAVCAALVMFSIYKGVLLTGNALDLRSVLLSLVDENMKVLASEEIALKQDEIALKRGQLQAKIRNLPFELWFWNVFSISLGFAAVSSLLLVSFGWKNRLSVHVMEIRGAKIPVKSKDLRNVYPVAFDLALAEKMESAYPEKAFMLYQRMADIRIRELHTLIGKRSLVNSVSQYDEPLVEHAQEVSLSVPDFQQVLDGITPGGKMILGFDYYTGEPIEGTFDNLYSSFLAGKSGTGKSSWLRALILQSLKAYPDIRFFVLDPHAEHPESLSKSLPKTENFIYLNAKNPRKGIYAFNDLLQRRLDHLSSEDAPAVFVVDEFSFCSRQKYAESLKVLLERVSNEGRKAKCYALLSSQDTRLKRSGDFRDMLSSSYVFALKPNQARYLLQDREEVLKVKMLFETKARGVALFAPSENESRLVRLPFCSNVPPVHRRDPNEGSVTLKKLEPLEPLEKPEEKDGVLLLLDVVCMNRQEGMSKNAWQKQTAEKVGISFEYLKNLMLGHATMSAETRAKIESWLKTENYLNRTENQEKTAQ